MNLDNQILFIISVIVSILSILAFLLFDFPFLFLFLLFPPFILKSRSDIPPINLCGNCDAKISQNWKVCPYCGESILLERPIN